MITESSITKNTGRYAMIDTAFFYVPVKFAFNLPLYFTSYMHQKQKKRKERKKKATKNLLQGDLNPDPQNQLKLKVNALLHWNTSVNADNSPVSY